MQNDEFFDFFNEEHPSDNYGQPMFAAEPCLPDMLDILGPQDIDVVARDQNNTHNSNRMIKTDELMNYPGNGNDVNQGVNSTNGVSSNNTGEGATEDHANDSNHTNTNNGVDENSVNQLLESMFGENLKEMLGQQNEQSNDSGIGLLDELLEELENTEQTAKQTLNSVSQREEERLACHDQYQGDNPSPDQGLDPADPAGNSARNRFEGAVRFKAKPAYVRSESDEPEGGSGAGSMEQDQVPKPFQIPNIIGRKDNLHEVVAVDPTIHNIANQYIGKFSGIISSQFAPNSRLVSTTTLPVLHNPHSAKVLHGSSADNGRINLAGKIAHVRSQDSYTKRMLSKKLKDLKSKTQPTGYLKILPKGYVSTNQQSLLRKNNQSQVQSRPSEPNLLITRNITSGITNSVTVNNFSNMQRSKYSSSNTGYMGNNRLPLPTHQATSTSNTGYSGNNRLSLPSHQVSSNQQYHPYLPRSNGQSYSKTLPKVTYPLNKDKSQQRGATSYQTNFSKRGLTTQTALNHQKGSSLLATGFKGTNSLPTPCSQKAVNLPTFRQLQLIEEDLENSLDQHRSRSRDNASGQASLPRQTSSSLQTAVPQQWLSPPRQTSCQAFIPQRQTNFPTASNHREKETSPVQKGQKIVPSHTTSPLTWSGYQKGCAPLNSASCQTGYAPLSVNQACNKASGTQMFQQAVSTTSKMTVTSPTAADIEPSAAAIQESSCVFSGSGGGSCQNFMAAYQQQCSQLQQKQKQNIQSQQEQLPLQQSQTFQQTFLNQLSSKQNYQEGPNHHLEDQNLLQDQNCHVEQKHKQYSLSEQLEKYKEDPIFKVNNRVNNLQTKPVTNKVYIDFENADIKDIRPDFSRNQSILNRTPWCNKDFYPQEKVCKLSNPPPGHKCNISCQKDLQVSKEIIRYPASHFIDKFQNKSILQKIKNKSEEEKAAELKEQIRARAEASPRSKYLNFVGNRIGGIISDDSDDDPDEPEIVSDDKTGSLKEDKEDTSTKIDYKEIEELITYKYKHVEKKVDEDEERNEAKMLFKVFSKKRKTDLEVEKEEDSFEDSDQELPDV